MEITDKNMNDIWWHDCMINRVVETPSASELVMEVDYPTDMEKDLYEPRSIVFTDPLDYHIQEGPFKGTPAILDATMEDAADGYRRIILETNAGRRTLRFRRLELRPCIFKALERMRLP